jgi:hypothetical protein
MVFQCPQLLQVPEEQEEQELPEETDDPAPARIVPTG